MHLRAEEILKAKGFLSGFITGDAGRPVCQHGGLFGGVW